MTPISRPDAIGILDPHFPLLDQIFRRAQAGYAEYPAILRMDHSKRSRASIMHDLIVRYAREVFEGVPGVVFRTIRGLFIVEIAGRLFVRFKKLDKRLMPSSIPTNQANMFYDQQMEQLHLDGIPPVTGLVAGYRFDMFEQDIEACIVTCPIGKNIHWSIDIRNPIEVQESIEPIVRINPKKSKIRAKQIAKTIRRAEDGID